jgi:hypothetical protein
MCGSHVIIPISVCVCV